MKLKKVVSAVSAFALVFAIGCVPSFAETSNDEYTVVDNMIDYSVYDSDMVYIQEHADLVAEYNETITNPLTRATTYTEWSWSNGIYSYTSRNSSAIAINRSFTPVNSYLYFNVDVSGVSSTPWLGVNKLNSNNTLTYVGSYNITSDGNNNYSWTNYKRSLTSGQKYVFSLLSNNRWSTASIDIYKSSM